VTDITQEIADNPVQGEGILTAVNNLHNEIIFTFRGYKYHKLKNNTTDGIYSLIGGGSGCASPAVHRVGDGDRPRGQDHEKEQRNCAQNELLFHLFLLTPCD